MALEYHTLKYKPQQTTKDADGRNVVSEDLLAKTWGQRPDDMDLMPLIVNEYYVARPDLISLAIYGNDMYGDMICKFNGISNPFELNEGMVLMLPPLYYATTGCEKREMSSCERIKRNDSIQEQDNTKIFANEVHSPSATVVGDKPPFIIDRTAGIVIY